MFRILRPLLFSLPPETAHRRMVGLLRTLSGTLLGRSFLRTLFAGDDHGGGRELSGIEFPDRVGLAAGFDKNAEAVRAMEALGFGFMEVGTVTPLPQKGNPPPRIFRLREDRALINRLGFNNDGVEKVADRLRRVKERRIVVGGNIGKNKDTPNERAVADYEACFRTLFDLVDYFVVNVSSPNTPGLRGLQEKGALRPILDRLQGMDIQMAAPKPLFIKIAPDLDAPALDGVIDTALESGVAGIVATNTTQDRPALKTSQDRLERIGDGGLSGAPLADRSTGMIRYIEERSGGALPVIGVGGIDSPERAREKVRAGADLIQLYTGFIYEGPCLIRRIQKALRAE